VRQCGRIPEVPVAIKIAYLLQSHDVCADIYWEHNGGSSWEPFSAGFALDLEPQAACEAHNNLAKMNDLEVSWFYF